MKVVVSTCDKYSWLIPTFWHFYKKNWKDNPYKTEIVTETKKLSFGDSVFYGGKIPWADLMIKYLKQLDEDKFLLILDDYILESNVDSHRVKIAENLCKDDVGCVKLSIHDEGDSWDGFMVDAGIRGFKRYPKKCPLDKLHSVSFQAAIWQKSSFLDIPRPGESIWAAESGSSKRFHKQVLRPDAPIMNYSLCGCMKKGKQVKEVMKWIKKNW